MFGSNIPIRHTIHAVEEIPDYEIPFKNKTPIMDKIQTTNYDRQDHIKETLKKYETKILECLKIVNDTSVDLKKRIKNHDMMFDMLSDIIFVFNDKSLYDRLLKEIENNDLDTNMDKYFKLSA
jgi:hypothetical protein